MSTGFLSGDFLSVGFRPFYLGAAGFACLAVPLWILQYSSGTAASGQVIPVLWHAHEMVFGFAPAVIVGFLLTAARNWTGRQTPAGASLAGLFALWLLARAGNWWLPGLPAVLLDSGFLIAAAASIGWPILAARNRRNYFVIALLTGLAAASALHGLAIHGYFAGITPTQATRLAMDLVLVLMVVVGGRVIPAFSANAIASLTPSRWLVIETGAIATALGILIVDLFEPGGAGFWWQPVCLAAALVHLIRLVGWQPWKTRGNALLFALPLAYLWIPVHLLLRALESPLAMHALTVGAMSSLMLAMMTRSALGHTGRPLQARSQELICFGAIHLAALCRIVGPLLAAEAYLQWMWLAACFWSLGFGMFFLAYWPILTGSRLTTRS